MVSTRLDETRIDWLESWRERTAEPNPIATSTAALESVMAAELRRVPLSTGEANLIAMAVGQPLLSTAVGSGMIAAEVADFAAGLDMAIADLGLTSSDVEALVARLWSLGPAADLALRDAFSRWWVGQGDSTASGFAAVGLRVQ